MDLIKIGKFIAKCRKDKNLTQLQLAEKLSVTDRAVSKWENGRSLPDSSIMLNLCNALGITVNELLAGERLEKEDINKANEENLLSIIKDKEDSDRRLLLSEVVFGTFGIATILPLILLGALLEIEMWLRLVLIFAMSESISSPIVTGMLATGNIKKYQIIVGLLQMMNLPISYIFLLNGFAPEMVFVVAIIISQFCLVARLCMAHYALGISLLHFLLQVYLNVITVSFISLILPSIIVFILQESFNSFILSSITSVICTMLTIYFIGCNKKERKFINGKILSYYHKFI